MTYKQKIETIKNLLIKYADPKVEYDGITAYNLAEMILKETEDTEDKDRLNCKKCGDLTKDEGQDESLCGNCI